MKKINKILLLVVLLATTLMLTSCKKADTSPIFPFYDLDVNNLLVDEIDESKKLESLSFYKLLATGGLDKITLSEADGITYLLNGDDTAYTKDELVANGKTVADAVAKNYTYTIKYDYKVKKETISYNKDFTITQIEKGNHDKTTKYIDYLKFDDKGKVKANGIILTNSYLFEGKNIDFNVINGTSVDLIDTDNLTFTGFPVGDELIENKKYINHKTFDLKANDEAGNEFDFQIRLQATAKPLSVKTSSFWNWIFLQTPIAFVMSLLGKIFFNSFAVAILFTTIIVRTLAWPIYAKTNDMSMKMSVAQPEIDRLQKKYAARKDPESQQKMQMEMMQLYKKHNINMFGCLLPFLQMPIFFAMFEVVKRITIPGGQFYSSVHNTKFLGTDLASGGTVAKIIFTALVGITMFALQKISQVKPSYAKNTQGKPNPQAQQTEQTMKMVSFFMIFMMIMTSYVTPGLALSYYWIIGNFYSILQTLINKRINENKYKKLQEEKLYGASRQIIDAKVSKKGDK
jgi:YidC/Oxa1 family membrane protein insertase